MDIEKKILLEENELKPNRYVANAALFSLAAITFIQFLNDMGIFHVHSFRMVICTLIVLFCSLTIQIVGRTERVSALPGTKYLASSLIFIETLAITTALAQWTELLIALPILLALQYHNRRMTAFAIGGTLFVALFAAPLSVLFRFPQLDYYDFLIRSIGYRAESVVPNPDYNLWYYIWGVFKYISVPRCVLVIAFAPVAGYVTKLVSLNIRSRIDATYYSSTDILTGILNRFSFSSKVRDYEAKRPACLICVYADADGLHELNNQFGHEAGDEMLKAAANQMRDAFGDYTYRLGGDEFLSFVESNDTQAVTDSIERIRAFMVPHNYHMSLGFAALEKDEAVADLIRRAESQMFAAKREYYVQSGKDRRKHRG